MYQVKIIKDTAVFRDFYTQHACRADQFTAMLFSLLLEESGSISKELGWSPHHFHFTVEDYGSFCIPTYAKTHSWGEFSFDHSWANLAMERDINYYPKLQVCFPFVPTSLPYFPFDNKIRKILPDCIKEMVSVADRGFSSLHFTFPDNYCGDILASLGFVCTTHPQYIWENNKYYTFNDFLETLSSKNRYMIRKEREEICEMGITTEFYKGNELSLNDLESIYDIFDCMHKHMKWGNQAFNYRFLELLNESLKSHLLAGFAFRNGKRIAASLNFIHNNTILGRFWGSRIPERYVHYELCYYALIEYAIKNSCCKVEVGSTGDHKRKRGFIPRYANNYHWITDPELRSDVIKIIKETA